MYNIINSILTNGIILSVDGKTMFNGEPIIDWLNVQ